MAGLAFSDVKQLRPEHIAVDINGVNWIRKPRQKTGSMCNIPIICAEDVSYMKRHRNMLCGVPILEVDEVCDLLKMSDRQLRRYRTSGQLVGFHFGRRLMFSTAEINRFIERVELEHKQKRALRKAIHNL